MRILFIDPYYPRALQAFYSSRPHLRRAPYAEQRRALMDHCFGWADFCSVSLGKLGCEAVEIVANGHALQRRWAREHALRLWASYPFHRTQEGLQRWLMAVLWAQIEQFRPDVIHVQEMNWTSCELLRRARDRVRLIVGQIACPLESHVDLAVYDLIITSFPHYVTRFRERGLAAEYLPLAFGPRVLERLGPVAAEYAVSFAGGYSARHRAGTEVFERLARATPVDFWGYGAETLPEDSPIRQRFHGEAWGLDMYRVLAASQIALNRHIDVAENYANNMRLYEATGVGVCLVTDRKDNLSELFEPDREIVAYSNAEECLEKVRHLLTHERDRAAIAQAGQRRTLRDHTFDRRMQQLLEIIRRRL